MLSHSTQTLLVQARIDELHRVARTSNRPATPLATLVKRTLNRVFDGDRAGSAEAARTHGVQMAGYGSTMTWSRR